MTENAVSEHNDICFLGSWCISRALVSTWVIDQSASRCLYARAPSVHGAEGDGRIVSEPHCRVEGLLEVGVHPVQEVDFSGRHRVEAEQSCVVVQKHPDPAGYRVGGNHRGRLVSVAEGEGGWAAAETPREGVVSQPAVIGWSLMTLK